MSAEPKMPVLQELSHNPDIQSIFEPIQIENFSSDFQLASHSTAQRMVAALQVFFEILDDDVPEQKVDKHLLNDAICKIDDMLSEQLDLILHHPDFQKIESLWQSLGYLVGRTDFRANTKIELLDVSKAELQDDFENADEIRSSGLYKHVYEREYDTPGGEPISSIISDYSFTASHQDISLLQKISSIAELTHAPFIGNVSGQFFQKDGIGELQRIEDLSGYLEGAEYIRWQQFRKTESARYIGLAMPKFLLRMPYGEENPIREFNYVEDVSGKTAHKYLWGAASFAFAANLTKSFCDNGWLVNIRGPEAGGKVDRLILHQYDYGRGLQTKMPTEMIIPESLELELSNQGFIPLSYYKNSDYACFFSANSIQKPTEFLSNAATANSRVNVRLPYIYLSSRLAHYLKVLQREHIGSNISRSELERQLNDWIQSLVTKMNNPDPEQIATHPLRDGYVEVTEVEDNPGFYRVGLSIMPHFQIEGVDVRLSLVAQLPNSYNGEQ